MFEVFDALEWKSLAFKMECEVEIFFFSIGENDVESRYPILMHVQTTFM